MDETNEIQKRMTSSITKKEESREKAFVRLMMFGKIGQAAKFINNDDAIKGVHQLNNEIKGILSEKHPSGREADPSILLQHNAPSPQPVIFEEIDAEKIHKIARNMKGSGGPTHVESDSWKEFLCSKSHGNASNQLCQAVADLAKILSTEDVHPDSLTEYNSCRLIPLDKGVTKDLTPGVRPIGVGEVLKRIIGKALISVIKDDIVNAAGPLQTCTGLRAGIEASIHAMRRIFDDDDSEAIILVDAENAFNNLNRKAALHNIRELCPPFYQYLHNTYQKPANLIISGEAGKYETILSQEGSTQGDVIAMHKYGLGIKPLTSELSNAINTERCKQAWYADDSSAAGRLVEMRKWWNTLCTAGPKYGYFPLPTKTILIVKEEYFMKAEEVFADTGVTITKRGERHMGAVIGTINFKKEYVNGKVEKWVKDIDELSKIAKDEPQYALSSFTKAISHRWTYAQRTIPDIRNLFQPLENVIREKFIPSLVGRRVSDVERRIMALPVRLGGMGITNPVSSSDDEFLASSEITDSLANIIYHQEQDFTNYNKEDVDRIIKRMKIEKEKKIEDELNEILNVVDDKTKRSLELAREKGAGLWLTALPIKSLGYTLNKQEFKDSVCMRYGWRIANTPSHCQCGQKNDIDHTLCCKKGGYVSMRHNQIRDMEAELMREVCKDVKVEPELLPLETDRIRNGNLANKARLDVSGNGVWGPFEKTFLDIRVMHPNAPSYRNKSISQVYATHEKEKKRSYNERVIQIEKGTFTPIVMSTSGGMGNEANRHHKRIATLIAAKRKEDYADVMNYIRTRLRFCLLRSTLIAIRGVRGRQKNDHTTPISEISFNLLDDNQ